MHEHVRARMMNNLMNDSFQQQDIMPRVPRCLAGSHIVHTLFFVSKQGLFDLCIIPLFTLGSIYSTNASGAEQMTETNYSN